MKVSSIDNPVIHASGFHMTGRNNDNVQGLHGSSGNLQKFPRKVNKIFKNLIAIYFSSGQIRDLSSEDLKSFPELVELNLENNKIEVIEEGIFDLNPKLKGISFMSNKIFYISPNVFDHMTDLNFLQLDGNPCAFGATRADRNSVLNLISTVKSSCQSPTILRMERKLKSVTHSSINIDPRISIKDDTLVNFENLKERMDIHDKNLVEFKAAILKKLDDFEIDYKNMHAELMGKIEKKLKSLES